MEPRHHQLRAIPGGSRLRLLLHVRAPAATICVLFGLGGGAVVLALAIDLGIALTTRKA